MFGGKAVKKLVTKVAKPAEEKPAKKNGLTEAELLRAPASQYMSAEQLAFFRERLLETQKEMLEKIFDNAPAMIALRGPDGKMTSAADIRRPLTASGDEP